MTARGAQPLRTVRPILPPRSPKPAKSHDLTGVGADGRLAFNLHAGQWKAWKSKARHVVILAGTQGGKTSFGPVWLFREIQNCGPGDYLVVTPSFPLLALKLLPEFLKLFGKQLQLGRYVGSPVKKFVFSPAGARKVFGDDTDVDLTTQIFFAHAKDPDSVESATVKAAWLDEAGQKKFKRATREAIMRRLAIHRGRVLYTTTPYYLGWLKRDLHDKADGVNIEVINFASTMNPSFSQQEYDEMKATLPAWKFSMFYDGQFTRPAGMIYDCYSWEECTVEPFDVPAHWPRVFGLDFGAVNTCCVKCAMNPVTGEWFVYGYYLHGGRTAKAHAAVLLAGEDVFQVTAVGGAGSESNWRDEFTDAGLKVDRPSIADVEVGIMRVYGLLKVGKLFVFRNIEALVGGEETDGEFDTYSRTLDEAGDPTDAIEDKNKYHALDALRYAGSIIGEGLPLPAVTLAGRR